MTDDRDIEKKINTICDEKYKFICYTMAEIIRNNHSYFPASPFWPTMCPQPVDISSNKYNPDDFNKVLKKRQDQGNIKNASVHKVYDVLKTSVKVGSTVAAIPLAYVAGAAVGAYVGVSSFITKTIFFGTGFGLAQANDYIPFEITEETKYMPVFNNEYVKQYGLVIYEDKKFKLDKIYYLADMLSENTDMRPYFDIGGEMNEMIKKIAQIRNKELKKLGGTNKNHCLQNTGGVYPIYGVGTFKSKDTYDEDEYHKGMYVMFVAGVYNFFEIMKYVLLKKYKNQYCQTEEHTYYEAMQRMQIQIGTICDKAFGITVGNKSRPVKEIIVEEMKCALDPDFSNSFKIDYCKKFATLDEILPGMPELGWKAVVGLGAVALYGLKKWRDYKKPKASSSSSSSSSSKKRSSSKRGSRRSRSSEIERSSRNRENKKSTHKRSRR